MEKLSRHGCREEVGRSYLGMGVDWCREEAGRSYRHGWGRGGGMEKLSRHGCREEAGRSYLGRGVERRQGGYQAWV